jgi:hypothetical protein
MKCPYCVAVVDDKALACPSCRRDFIFFIPLLKRIDGVKDELSQFISQMRSVKLEIVARITEREDRLSRFFHAGKVVWVYTIQWIALMSISKESTVLEGLTFLSNLIMIMATPFGIWSGFVKYRARRRYFILVGAILGITDLILSGIYYEMSWVERFVSMLGGVLWYYTGSVLGSKLVVWAGPHDMTGIKELTAAELLTERLKETSEDPDIKEEDKSLKSYAALFAPLITSIITTIISALLKKDH